MNSPLVYIPFYFPGEIVNHIHSYMQNNIIYEALNNYFNYLHYREDLYSDFVLKQYVTSSCYCNYSLHKYGVECEYCYNYEYCRVYVTNEFHTCIDDNDQYRKIVLYDES